MNKPMQEEEKKNKKRYVTTYQSPETGLAEMLYDPVQQTTCFNVSYDNGFITVPSIKLKNGMIMEPLNPSNELVRLGFIKFPSDIEEYGSETDLFEEIKSYINEYVQIPQNFVAVCALYIMLTWLYDRFHVLPYLRVIGTFGTGKTRFQEVIGNACYKPLFVGSSTSLSAIFRTLHEFQGTLVFDEADFKNSESWNEIVKILNAGHTSGFPVIRMESTPSGYFKTRAFYVFGPKIMASRERFNDQALESRCLTCNLMPLKNLKAPIHLPNEFKEKATRIRNKLLCFRYRNYMKVNADVVEPEQVSVLSVPRLKQTFLSMINIADMVGGKSKDDLLQFAKSYEEDFSRNQAESFEADILVCIASIIKQRKEMFGTEKEEDVGKIYMLDISDRFNYLFARVYEENSGTIVSAQYDYWINGDERSPNNHKTISPRRVGHIVNKKLGVKTDRDRHGIFIMESEFEKIGILLERYGITEEHYSMKMKPGGNGSVTMPY